MMKLDAPRIRFEPSTPSFNLLEEEVNHWYLCPLCGKISLGWIANWTLEGREFALRCRHRFLSSQSLPVLDREIVHHDLVTMFIKFETKEADGTISQRLFQRSDSYLGNMAGLLSRLDVGAGVTATNLFGTLTGGTQTAVTASNTITPGATAANGNGGINLSINGMFVGTGNTANSADTPGTSALATPIANGTAANQLQWTQSAINPVVLAASTYSFQSQRTFTNNSPTNPIGITEVGIVWGTGGTVSYIIRDVLGSTVNVANAGASTTGTYVIGITVS